MRLSRLAAVAAVAVVGGTVFAGLSEGTLSIAGNSIPTDFISKDGRTYVPIADVAKALNMSVAKSGSSYVLTPAGGANQVAGLSGKVGQVLNGGIATVKLVKVIITDKYQYQFNSGDISPNNANEQLVVTVIRIKNATSKTLWLDPQGTDHTALVDNDEHSYRSYHGPGQDLPGNTNILPGAALDFALTFSVPKSETATQLVYGLNFNGMNDPHKDFRIDLK